MKALKENPEYKVRKVKDKTFLKIIFDDSIIEGLSTLGEELLVVKELYFRR